MSGEITWSSIETAKLTAQAVVPLVVAWLAYRLSRRALAKRVQVYDALAPGLNDLYCSLQETGDWKYSKPPELAALKQTLDKAFQIHEPLFSTELRDRYHAFSALCLQAEQGRSGKDGVRAQYARLMDRFSAELGAAARGTPRQRPFSLV